jgi:hypothetical protein
VPFSGDPWGVWVPWRHELWFWPHYEIFFSHYGRLFTVLVAAIPLVSWKLGTRGEHGRERWIAAAAAAIAIAVMLPTQLRPVGFFGAFPRYFAFIVPIVAAWTVAPVIDAVTARSRPAMGVLATAIALIFAGEAVTCALHDRFAPLEYAIWARDHPGTRFIWFYPLRAGSIVDRDAGPREKVAVDSSFETWVHPAFGRDLQRPVMFLRTGATASDIPADAAWVMIDRSWNALWGNPEFRTMGQMAKYIGQGTASPDDLRLYEILRRDRRFRLVYRDEQMNQAVFRRVAP